jgi:hypothetical protein
VYSPSQAVFGNFNVNIAGAEVDITNTREAFEGYNLFVLLRVDQETLDREFFMLIVDMNGEVIVEEYLPENFLVADCPAEFIDPSTILVRSSDTTSIYNITDGTMTLLPFEGHHEFEYNPINDTIFTFHYNIMDIDGEDYRYDTLLEYDRSGNIVWSFDVSSLIRPDQECPYQDFLWGYPDISHSNTIYYDVEEDSIYLMLRNANTFWKIDHATGDVIWGLGEHGNFSLFDRWGQPADNLFFHAHAVEPIDDKSFILFDNDLHNQTNELNLESRMIEITIDEDTMTANNSWVWIADSTYSSYIWGDADRLPNGNRLGVFGVPFRHNTKYGGRIVEVNEDHQTVWEMSFVSNESYRYGIYRNERFQTHPVVEIIGARSRYSQGDVKIDWNTWFNYRPKRDLQGSFDLYLDGALVQEGEVIFDRYWRPTTLSHTFQNLSLGTYNATIVVRDGYGNSARLVTEIKVSDAVDITPWLFVLPVVGVIALIILWRYRKRS